MTEPVLYSFRRCPYAMRARLALMISANRCELREIKLSAKPEAMLEASPKGTVPVLVLSNGEVVDQSLDIMRWALSQCDPENWLARDDQDLIAENDGAFKHDLDRYKYPHRHDSDAMEHRSSALKFLSKLNDRLSCGGQLCGSERGLADAAIMPFVRQFSAVEPDWFKELPYPALQQWLEGHLASDLFESVMVRFAPWAPEDDPIYFFG